MPLYANAEGLFDLFDLNRGKEKAPPPAPVQAPPPPKPLPPPPKPKPPQQDFILRGTNILGKQRSAVLQAPGGKIIVQKLSHGKAVKISGYPEYELLEIAPRRVKLRYPQEVPCSKSDPQKGLRCRSETLAELNLIRAKPTAPRPQPQPPVNPQSTINVPPPASLPGAPNNNQPQANPNQNAGFQPHFIKDEDIPAGMRRIRTPFGDRLVPLDSK